MYQIVFFIQTIMDEEWLLTSFDTRLSLECRPDLAGDNVPDKELTLDPADAGVASSQASSSDEAFGGSGCILRAGPRRRLVSAGGSTATLQISKEDVTARTTAFFA